MKTSYLGKFPLLHNRSTRYSLSDVGSAVYSPVSANIDAPSSQERSGSDQRKYSIEPLDRLSDSRHRQIACQLGGQANGQPRGASIPFNFLRKISSWFGLKSRTPQKSLNFFGNSGVSWHASFLAEMMRRALAPLRKIVSRDLEVFELRRNSVHPQSFAVHDRLECGHVHTSLLWDIFDLLFAYTESPHARAIRHRCQECLTLAAKKPVQSVAAVAKAA